MTLLMICICLIGCEIGFYFGRKSMKKELYNKYKSKTDEGNEPLAIDILINSISR
jgi:hypothetical protein